MADDSCTQLLALCEYEWSRHAEYDESLYVQNVLPLLSDDHCFRFDFSNMAHTAAEKEGTTAEDKSDEKHASGSAIRHMSVELLDLGYLLPLRPSAERKQTEAQEEAMLAMPRDEAAARRFLLRNRRRIQAWLKVHGDSRAVRLHRMEIDGVTMGAEWHCKEDTEDLFYRQRSTRDSQRSERAERKSRRFRNWWETRREAMGKPDERDDVLGKFAKAHAAQAAAQAEAEAEKARKEAAKKEAAAAKEAAKKEAAEKKEKVLDDVAADVPADLLAAVETVEPKPSTMQLDEPKPVEKPLLPKVEPVLLPKPPQVETADAAPAEAAVVKEEPMLRLLKPTGLAVGLGPLAVPPPADHMEVVSPPPRERGPAFALQQEDSEGEDD